MRHYDVKLIVRLKAYLEQNRELLECDEDVLRVWRALNKEFQQIRKDKKDEGIVIY